MSLRSRWVLPLLLPLALFGACGDNGTVLPGPDGGGADAPGSGEGGPTPDGSAGCTISITAPASPVTTDADSATTGVQADVTVQVGAACSGKVVTLSSCDVGGPLTATATSGTATFHNVTLCALDACPKTVAHCTASVTNGGTSMAMSAITVDTLPPPVTLVAAKPPGVCGGSVSPSDDVDPDTAGVQIQVSVLTVASNRWAEVTPGNGAHIPVDATGLATITLNTGSNSIVGKAIDDAGLMGTSDPCVIELANLLVSIATPSAGATLGPKDGTASAQSLAVQVCGAVGEPTTTTVTVTVDNQAASAVTATIDNTDTGHWCAAGVAVPEGSHEIEAKGASTTGDTGTARAQVTVDLTAPPPPTGIVLAQTKRNTVGVSFTAPNDGGQPAAHCTVKSSTSPIPDAAAYDAISAAGIDAPGLAGGTTQTIPFSPVRPEVATYLAVRCFDAAENASGVLSGGPFTTHATASGTLLPIAGTTGYDVTNAQFGRAMVGADLNDDGFTDLVVGAPGVCKPGTTCTQEGLVYIYLGSASGIATTPSFILRATDASGQSYLGKSIAVLDWNHDGVQDIAVGAPFSGGLAGAVFVWLGDRSPTGRWTAGASPKILDDTTADLKITPDQTDDWLQGTTAFGWQVRSGDFDGDGHDDLLVSANGADALTGGVVIIYGAAGNAPTGTLGVPGDLAGAGVTGRGFMFSSITPMGVEYGGFIENLGKLGDGDTPSADTRDDFVVAPVPGDFPDNGTAFPTLVVFYGEPQASSAWTKVDAMTAGDQFITGPTNMNVSKDRFAYALASIDDLNGDGRREVVVADHADGTGTIWIVPGGVPGNQSVLTDAWTTLDGGLTAGGLGNGLAAPGAGGGDFDGDGLEDIVVTSDSTLGHPSLMIWFGGSPQGSNVFGAVYNGPAAFSSANQANWVGDLNGDGLPDLAWADNKADDAPPRTGAVQVLY